MTTDQYSTIQRCLGKLEGLAYSLPEPAVSDFYDTIEALDAVVDEVYRKQEAGE